MSAPLTEVAIVVPTIGRPSLRALLASLAESGRRTGIPVPVDLRRRRSRIG